MSLYNRISFEFSRKLPLILQTEATECGLACLGMISGFYGRHTDLTFLRRQYPISLKGATLVQLGKVSNRLNLSTRALKLEIEELAKLKLPCILHWNFNHFVVLKEVGKRLVTIHDPAVGTRRLVLDEVSKSFTGVALEVWPNSEFSPKKQQQTIKLKSFIGQVKGLTRSLVQILILAFTLEIFSLVSPFFLQWVIDHVIVSSDRHLMTTLAVGFGLLVLMQQSVSAFRSWAIIYLGTTLSVQWRANVFTHLIRLPVQYFEKRHLGDVVSRFGSIDQIQKTLTTSFIEAILDGLTSLATLIMMFIYSAMLGSIAVGTMILYGILRWVWHRPFQNAMEEQIVQAAKQQSHFLETVRGVKAIKLFQRHDERRSTWLNLVVNQINADLKTQKLHLLYRTFNGLLFGIENVCIIWLGATLVMDGAFTVGALMAFHSYKGQFNNRISSLIDKIFEFKMLRLHGERLADIVMHEPENSHGHLRTSSENHGVPTIEVSNLYFRYAEYEPWILNNVNLKINPGESVAIIGSSGCGKTTLFTASNKMNEMLS